MKAIRYIGQAVLTALIGTTLWAGASIIGVAGEIIGGVFRFFWGVFITLLSIAVFFGLIMWLMTI